jgi:DNA-binding transcriptional LysR family regulator
MAMDPHLLRTFTAVARLGSFSAAAGELGYTQSAVSQHIAALEADLGTELLSRRPVAPTEAGARLLDHAGPLLTRLAAARADVVRVAGAPAAALALGVCGVAFGPRAADALAELRAALPRAEVTLRALDRAELTAAVAAGDLDAGLVGGVAAPTDPLHLPQDAGLTVTGCGEEPLCVLLPAGHPLSGRAGLRLGDLADGLWLDAPAGAAPLADLRAATGGGFPAALRYDGPDVRTLLALVAAGHGLAALPRSAAPGDLAGGVAAVPVTEPRLTHRVELVHRPDPGDAVALFAESMGTG